MSDVNDTELVKEILNREDDLLDGDFVWEIHNYPVGSVLDFSKDAEVPAGWVFKITEIEDSRDYNSYGNSHTDSAYVIISVTDADSNSANYKLPGGYSSYEGWSWELNNLTRVTKQARVITSWDWVA